jgi:MFS family permease
VTSEFPVVKNTLLLAASLTALSGTLQLAAAVAATTLVLVSGIEGILGLGPAILLSASAAAAFPAGRAMDRYGRVPVLAVGFVIGAIGCVITSVACKLVQAPLAVLGLAVLGASQGIVLLARAAAGDMYPAERRARGISFVLFGAVFGALLGPFVFGPLFSGRDLDTDALVLPWLAAAGFMVIGLALTLAVRPDPRRIAVALAAAERDAKPSAPPSPLGTILRRPGIAAALVAAVASFAVMVSVMNLTGYVMIGHGHEQADVFPVISGHIVGMYGLVLVVGDLIDRMGRRRALFGGLFVMGGSTLALAWVAGSFATGVALFGLGLGWSFSYVAATSQLIDLAAPAERGRLIGFCDLVAALSGASLALLGGVTYSELGVGTLAAGAAVAATAPAAWIFVAGRRRTAPAFEPSS